MSDADLKELDGWHRDFRAGFPIITAHPGLAYLDSAATAQKPRAVLDAVQTYLTTANANAGRGTYPWANRTTELVERTRRRVGEFLGDPGGSGSAVHFTSGTTEGLRTVARDWLTAHLTDGDEILVPHADHRANLDPWREAADLLAARGVRVRIRPLPYQRGSGDYDHRALPALVGPRTRFVAATHVHHVYGGDMNVHRLRAAVGPGVPICLDAAQSVGHLPVSVSDLDVDFVVFSGHKALALPGTGAVWARNDPRRGPEFRPGGWRGTPNTVGIASLEAALDALDTAGVDRIARLDRRPHRRACAEPAWPAARVDQATITGEPLPVPKRPGDEVFAGTLNGTGAVRVRVERDPSDSVIARIVRMVEEASETKAPAQLFIEKIEQRYSIGMVTATLALFLIPLALGAEVRDTLLRAMTFMIVASPCAVVLATMPPLLSAIANAGRHGVLVKSAVVMERLGRIDTVALDKTGTLTEGVPQVTDLRPLTVPETDLLTLAAAAEHPSEHPLARAVVEAARALGLALPPATDFASAPGVGVTATVRGATIRVGAPSRLPVEGPAAAAVRDLEAAGRTAVVVTRDGDCLGVLGIADRVRPDAPATIAALTALTGTGPLLLTGDNARAAHRVATEVGIAGDDVHAGLLPEDKVTAVRRLTDRDRKVLLVGDGVNDAPALAAAHTGVAMGRAGSDLALETADAVVVRDELATVPQVVALSRRAHRLVTQNLVIAGTFIAALSLWDLFGTLPLPLGVAGHEGSTVLVGLNGLRLLREKAWGIPRASYRQVPSPG
ncbi:Cysteine desulfurase [Streptomyces fumanus]